MTLRAQQVAVAALRDVEFQRERIRRTVSHVATGAHRRSGLEAAAERERLRAIEAVRAAVGPELTLQIVVGNRIADQERRRVV